MLDAPSTEDIQFLRCAVLRYAALWSVSFLRVWEDGLVGSGFGGPVGLTEHVVTDCWGHRNQRDQWLDAPETFPGPAKQRNQRISERVVLKL